MDRVALIGLVKIELPAYTILLCDGGWVQYDGEDYSSSDPSFGTIASIDPLVEGVGNEVPALDIIMFPPSTTAVADLSQSGYQKSRVRVWIGEFNVDLGTLDGDPDLMFDGQIDQTTLTVGKDKRELSMSIVSSAERLFERNMGNSLNPIWHKSVWPGEEGHDNATGLTTPVAWGVASGPVSRTTQDKPRTFAYSVVPPDNVQ